MVVPDGVSKPAAFEVEVRREQGVTLVALSGELDLSTAGELREKLVDLLADHSSADGTTIVRVDLTDVSFLGSTGVGMLVAAAKRVRTSGGTFTVQCNGRSPARRILEIDGLVDYLEVSG